MIDHVVSDKVLSCQFHGGAHHDTLAVETVARDHGLQRVQEGHSTGNVQRKLHCLRLVHHKIWRRNKNKQTVYIFSDWMDNYWARLCFLLEMKRLTQLKNRQHNAKHAKKTGEVNNVCKARKGQSKGQTNTFSGQQRGRSL